MSSKYRSTVLAFFLAAFMVIGLGQLAHAAAHAALIAVGEVDPVTGFPVWFQGNDGFGAGGMSLTLCTDSRTVVGGEPCLLSLFDPAGGAVAANINEALYYGATATGTNAEGASFLSICAVEAAGPGGAGGLVTNFALIRLRNLPVVGTYTVTTPCSRTPFIITVTDIAIDTDLRAQVASDGVAPGFLGTLSGPVEMFADNGTALPTYPGYLGDGITPGPLNGPLFTGGGTTFMVTGPAGFTPFSTNQFTVVGKLFALAPVVLANGQVTFNRNALGAGTVDFLIPKNTGAVTAQAVGVGTALPGEPILLTMMANGVFTASVPITAANPLPNVVAITFNLGVPGEMTQNFPLTVIPVGDLAKVSATRNSAGKGTLDFLIPQSPGAVTAQAVGSGSPLPGEPIVLTPVDGNFTASVPITRDNIMPANVAVTFNLAGEGQLTEIIPVIKIRLSSLLLMLPKMKQAE